MERTQSSKLGRLAIAAVSTNLAVVAALGVLLPDESHVFLPIVALILPLLTAAWLETLAQRLQRTEPASVRGTRGPTPDAALAEPMFWRKSA
jgi:hypothetical protein